jgi:hypothetical protein
MPHPSLEPDRAPVARFQPIRTWIFACGLLASTSVVWSAPIQEVPTENASPPTDQQETPAESRRKGFLVQVRLPITASVQEQVESTVRRIAEQTGSVSEASQRPVVVLEFDTSNGQNGRGSRLGSCLDLSRFLISNEVSSIELIAYLPAPKGYVDPTQPGSTQPRSELLGHAVLVALACNHLVMHRDASIGATRRSDRPALTSRRLTKACEIRTDRFRRNDSRCRSKSH